MGMILVTVNYRLNSFGFLQLDEIEDGEISNSNFGFLDQQMALKWIHRNIKNFNGDPNLITIHGQSAGGSSMGLHLTNKNTSSLINNVIMQSNPFGIPMKNIF